MSPILLILSVLCSALSSDAVVDRELDVSGKSSMRWELPSPYPDMSLPLRGALDMESLGSTSSYRWGAVSSPNGSSFLMTRVSLLQQLHDAPRIGQTTV